jgi:hypothetical protein
MSKCKVENTTACRNGRVKILQDMLKWKGENTTGYVEMEG